MTNYHKNNSTTAKRCEYDAYGKATIYDADYTERSASAIGNDYLFTGRRYDPETGNHYYRNRYYNQDLARFLQKDPLGIAPNTFMGNQNFAPKSQYTDGGNLYQYVRSNSLNDVDPYTDFAYYTFGRKRFHLTKRITGAKLRPYLSFIKGGRAGCKCKRYFLSKN